MLLFWLWLPGGAHKTHLYVPELLYVTFTISRESQVPLEILKDSLSAPE